MLRRSSLLLALALLACRAPGPGGCSSAAPEVAQPGHLLLPWGADLHAAPREDAIALRLGVTEDSRVPRPVVAVIGREGSYWKVETGSTIAGLDVYALQLYVAIGVGDPNEPADAPARALSSGPDRPGWFRVGPSATVYWADGREAGTVRTEHAFRDAGELRDSSAGVLRCFAVRVGPDEGSSGDLCFAESSRMPPTPKPEVASPYGGAFEIDSSEIDVWGNLEGIAVDEAYGTGGLGIVSTPEGCTDDCTDGGYGWGLIGLGTTGLDPSGGVVATKTTKVLTSKAKVSGSLDADLSRRNIRTHGNDIRDCWGVAGRGTIELELVVDATGKVADSKAITQDEGIGRCVEKAAKTWKFPARAGSITVTLSVEARVP